jgi:hypothetical protein
MAGYRPEARPSSRERHGGVFVGYRREDKAWLARLRVYLKPLERDFGVTLWIDTRLKTGQKWREEIGRAIARCQAALLLVSANPTLRGAGPAGWPCLGAASTIAARQPACGANTHVG